MSQESSNFPSEYLEKSGLNHYNYSLQSLKLTNSYSNVEAAALTMLQQIDKLLEELPEIPDYIVSTRSDLNGLHTIPGDLEGRQYLTDSLNRIREELDEQFFGNMYDELKEDLKPHYSCSLKVSQVGMSLIL